MSKEEASFAKIEAVVIMHKASGLVIININPGDVAYDLDFQLNPMVEKFSEEIGVLNLVEWGELKVLIEDGQLIRVALFLRGVLSTQFTEIVRLFIQEFEAEYREVLENWMGSFKAFDNATQFIASQIFERVGQNLL